MMRGIPLQSSPPSLQRLIVLWTILLGMLLTASNDFSWVDAPGRFLYWTLHIGLGLCLVVLVTRSLQLLWMSRLGQWAQLGISSIVAVIVFAPVGILLDILIPASFGPQGHADIQESARNTGAIRAVLEEVGAYAPTVVAVWLIVNLSYRYFNAGTDQQPDTKADDAKITSKLKLDAKTDGIFEKIPPALGHEVMLIRSDANYIHVHTTMGKTMFLYSLTKAAEELRDSGLRVHRSYWVSFDHVKEVKQHGTSTVCVMVDGTSVPVSRRRQKELFDYFGKDFVRAEPTT